MANITLSNLVKRFGSVIAVDDVSLEINDQEFNVLVGPSGCGKSTTLRMIAGLEEITSGEIHIGDRLVNDVPPKDRDIAMVFQNYALYPHMDVYNNMAFALRLKGFSKSEIDRRVKEAASMLGIEGLLSRKPRELSGGQRQRVAVGRAIVREPKAFLMDEPLSNLDAKLRVQMRAEITKLQKRLQVTTVYVTHDQTEAMTMGDRIVVMKDGVIQQVGPPLEVYRKPKNMFVAGFIGSPAMNFLEGILRRVNDVYQVQIGDKQLELPGEMAGKALEKYIDAEVFFGIRPEDIKYGAASADNPNRVEALIEVVEPLGAETYAYFTLAGGNVTARLEATEKPKVGEVHPFVFDMKKIHLFDKESGEAIT